MVEIETTETTVAIEDIEQKITITRYLNCL